MPIIVGVAAIFFHFYCSAHLFSSITISVERQFGDRPSNGFWHKFKTEWLGRWKGGGSAPIFKPFSLPTNRLSYLSLSTYNFSCDYRIVALRFSHSLVRWYDKDRFTFNIVSCLAVAASYRSVPVTRWLGERMPTSSKKTKGYRHLKLDVNYVHGPTKKLQWFILSYLFADGRHDTFTTVQSRFGADFPRSFVRAQHLQQSIVYQAFVHHMHDR